MAETNTQKAMRCFMAPMPKLEAALIQALTSLDVNTAVGIHLTRIGKKVGRARNGVTDDEIFRRYVRAQISANKSNGLIEDMLTIARLVVFDDAATYVLRNEGAAAFVLSVEGVAITDEVAAVLFELLRKATAAGVRIILEYSTEDPADVLYWTTQGVWGTAVWAAGTDEEI